MINRIVHSIFPQLTDHYMRTYYVAIDPELSNYKTLCVGHQPRHKVMLDYTKEVFSFRFRLINVD